MAHRLQSLLPGFDKVRRFVQVKGRKKGRKTRFNSDLSKTGYNSTYVIGE